MVSHDQLVGGILTVMNREIESRANRVALKLADVGDRVRTAAKTDLPSANRGLAHRDPAPQCTSAREAVAALDRLIALAKSSDGINPAVLADPVERHRLLVLEVVRHRYQHDAMQHRCARPARFCRRGRPLASKGGGVAEAREGTILVEAVRRLCTSSTESSTPDLLESIALIPGSQLTTFTGAWMAANTRSTVACFSPTGAT